MSAFESAQQQHRTGAQNGSLLHGALQSALEAALLPARLAGRAWGAAWGAAGAAVGGSERAVSGLVGALVGAAWGAATGGTELFILSLQKLLQHTPGRVQGMLPPRLLGAPEGVSGAAAQRAAGGEEEAQAVGLGGGYTLNVASAEAVPEEPTPQAEPATEREAEVAELAAKGGQFVEKAEPGIGVAAPREPATPARAPAFAPLSPERGAGLAAGPMTVEPFPAAGALGAEPRSPVAKIDAHMRTVQEFRAKTAEILKAEEALPGAEEEAGAGLAAPVVAGTGARAAEGRLTRRSPVPLERIPSDVTGQEGRPLAPGLEALPEGPEGTSAEGSAHAGFKHVSSTPLEAAAAGAGAALVPEKFQALEGPYGRGIYAPALYPGEEPALPPEAIAAVDLGDSEEEGEGPPPLASPSPVGELEEVEAGQAAGGEDGIFAPPAAMQARQPVPAAVAEERPAGGEEEAAAEGPLEMAEARLKGLFAPVGVAAATMGGFVGGGLTKAGAAAGGAAGAVADALHIPGLSRAGPEKPLVTAEPGAAGAGEAEVAPAPELQPPLAPAGAAAVEAEEEEKPAAAAEAVERSPTAAAAEAAAAPPAEAAYEPAAVSEAAAVQPAYVEGWEHGSEALLAGRSGERVGVQRVYLPALGRDVPLESRIVAEDKVEARRRHGHYWEHHHHHRHHQLEEPGQASAAHRLASAAAGVASEAVAPAAIHSRSAADRRRQLLRRLSSAAAALTGTQDGPAAEGGPLPAAAKPLLVGLAAVALMQSRLLGALAAAGVVVLVAAMLLGLLLVELARAIGSGLTGAVRWLSDPQVASEMVAAQKQRILEGRPPAAGAAAAAAPSAAAAVPTPPTETMLPGAEAVETAEPAAAAEGLAAEHEALRAAAAELAAAEEAAVERPAAAAAVVGEELGVTAVEEAREANVAEEKAPAAAEAARPSPFEAEEAAAGAAAAPAPKVAPAAEETVAVPPAPAEAAVVEKPVAAPVEEAAVAAPPTPAKAAAAAPSQREIQPTPPAPPAPQAPASTRAGPPMVPQKKKRNPIHKLQKMMGLKPYSTPRS